MNILMTADTIGGVWRYALELARGLEPFGVNILLATMGAPLSTEQRREVAALRHVRVTESRYKLVWMDDPWADIEAAGDWLLRLAENFKPALIHLNDYPHGALPWSAPVLMVGHSCVLSWWQAVHGVPAPARLDRYRDAVRTGLRAANGVIAPTAAMLAELHRLYGPLLAARVIFNGRTVQPQRKKKAFILSAGRLWDPGKNIAGLARIAPRLSWPVYVAGEARHPDGATAEFPNLRCLGPLSAKRLENWFAHASIYALPARYEPFGLSILEAASAGCALVLGDIASLREIWQDAALFIPPDDTERLASTLQELIDRPDLRHEYAVKARIRAARFTPERMAAAYWEIYRELTTDHRAAEYRAGTAARATSHRGLSP
ncbi:glycosyltransferase family 4 protein [Methylocaldum szegediense]|uniref:Glycosyltransferase involved in cell wall biosynthesis n=1 Tax=Methylocaldum szegediense TaxID=73780 RepID=A0ABN8X7Q9_9GAMM|nr:glycosyltransferase family 4 protein [Methylocaldum szegediense]CAI8925357.1 Glycosyltransferase involved in cell wall biosynthesis [Methylocaldum szegediense]